MRRLDDGIPVRARRSIAGRLFFCSLLTLTVIGVLGATAAFFCAIFWMARHPDKLSQISYAPSPTDEGRKWNHAELLGYLQSKGIHCTGYEGQMEMFGQGSFFDICEFGQHPEDGRYIRVWKRQTEREAHDQAGMKNKAFDWGLFVFEQHGNCEKLMAAVESVLR